MTREHEEASAVEKDNYQRGRRGGRRTGKSTRRTTCVRETITKEEQEEEEFLVEYVKNIRVGEGSQDSLVWVKI